MSKPFGNTTHSEIAQAFEAENRLHTFVEQREDGSHVKKYELRLTLEELFTTLDSLRDACDVDRPYLDGFQLNARQLRAKILATLGLFEEG